MVRRVLADELSAVGVYRQLAHGNYGSFILESAEHGGSWGRWSFVGASSAGAIVARDGHAQWIGSHPEGALEEGTFLEVVHSALEELAAPAIEGMPPLTGALVGSLGWGIIPEWEPTLAATAPKESDIPGCDARAGHRGRCARPRDRFGVPDGDRLEPQRLG